MKNLPVGRKLFVGFGIVILLTCVILVVTIVTSLDRNNQLNRINAMSDLQRVANSVLDDVNLARMEMRVVFNSTQADDEYTKAVEYLEIAEAQLPEMVALSTEQLDGYAAEANAQLAALIPQVEEKLEAIHLNDTTANQRTEAAVATGNHMAETSTSLFDLVSRLTTEMGETDPYSAMERVDSVLLPAQRLSESVDVFRIAARDLLIGQDYSVLPDLNAQIDDILSQCSSLETVLTTDEGRNAISQVESSIESYREEINEIAALLQNSEELVAEARTVNNQLETVIAEGVELISTDVNTMIESLTATSMTVMILLIAVVVLAILVSVLVAVYLTRAITRPLGKMQDVLKQAGGTGDLHFSDEVRNDLMKEAQAKDELGQSIGAFAGFVDRMVYIGNALETVANRDLTVEVDMLSDHDTMGNALGAMITNLNEMFAEINSISSQVATASGEVAVGAQSLAQGSTEQASTVQEISASVNEINEQMNTSNETATEAARQGQEISHIAQEGSQKMESMMGAVQQINDASQAIGAVIKVIDDIAFQTNILALNAAVEAARAGEHGKGFAVVADEVRNLAGKSADAAKETSALISANIEKAELGLSISKDTAESLTQIIEGINKTSESLQLVSEQSESAKAATSQVNLAVDQVAQVVQQNSATSEQSAAASEEMSSQAQVLQQLIARFKLKGAEGNLLGGGEMQQLPAASYEGAAEAGGDIIF